MTARLFRTGAVVASFLIAVGLFVWVAVSWSRLRDEVAASRLAVAAAKAQLMFIEDTLYANDDYLNDFISGTTQLCRGPLPENLLNRCSLLRYRTNIAYLEFLRGYGRTAAMRVRGVSPAQAPELEARYADLIPVLAAMGEGSATDQWLSRLYEGIAYARWIRADLSGAEAAIEKAKSLDEGKSAFVRLTALKIACARNVAAEDVRSQYAMLGERLRREAAQASGELARRNAALELHYYNDDGEVLARCSYASLGGGS